MYYCHITVFFLFSTILYHFFFFKICTGPVGTKMDKSPKTVHFSFEKHRGFELFVIP